jgi:hypothetical protein
MIPTPRRLEARVTDDDQPNSDDPPRTDVGDEARRVMAAVQDWARRTFPEPPSGHGGPECQWCPLCQFASVLRGERPELSEKVAEAGAALANAFKAIVDSAVAQGQSRAGTGEGAATRPTPVPRVQRIDLHSTDDGA